MAALPQPIFTYDSLGIDPKTKNIQRVPVFENFTTIFTRLGLLGKGGFGSVFLAKNNRSGELMAAKFIELSVRNTIDQILKSMSEVEMLRAINAKNKTVPPEKRIDIPEYYGSFLVRKPDLPGGLKDYDFVVMMEYIDGEDMDKVYKSWVKMFDPENPDHDKRLLQNIFNLSRWFYRTLANLHDIDVVHRDIKPVNIMKRNFDPENPNQSQFVLLDLGLTCRLPQSKLQKAPIEAGSRHDLERFNIETACRISKAGTVKYLAPEIFIGMQDLEGYKATDVWAAGVTFWELSNLKPFDHNTFKMLDFLYYIEVGIFPTIYMPPFDRVISESLNVIISKRPSAREIYIFIENFLKGDFAATIQFGYSKKLLVSGTNIV